MKKNIAIIFGSSSNEYPISLMSTYNVLNAIDHEKYNIHVIGITKKNEWYLYNGSYEKILNDTWHQDSMITPIMIDMSKLKLVVDGLDLSMDAAMIVMHGKYGEDGCLQGLLKMLNIKVAGCGVLASAIGMNKKMSHIVAASCGIKVTSSIVISRNALKESYQMLTKDLDCPLFVKPLNGGSSIGLTRIESKDQLEQAINLALKQDDQVVVEQEVKGFEVGCAIMGKDELVVGRVDEIFLDNCVFDFEQKYSQTKAKVIMPARIDHDLEKKIQESAKKIYRALGCQGFARVDMFISDANEIYFNEVNTIPGMTEHSRFSRMLSGVNISFPEVLDRIISESLYD